MNLLYLAQTDYETGSGGGMEALFGVVGILIWLAIVVVVVAGMWKAFTKAGKPGWAAIVPFYNVIVMSEIAGRPIWWFVLICIPFVGIVFWVMLMLDLAKSFGQGAGFGIGLSFLTPIFFLILGFGSAKYQGPAVTS